MPKTSQPTAAQSGYTSGFSVDTRAARSVVRVDGTACDLHLAGTGFAVAPVE